MNNFKISALANSVHTIDPQELKERIIQCWCDGDSVDSVDCYDVFVECITDPEGDFGDSAKDHFAGVLSGGWYKCVEFEKVLKDKADKMAEGMANGFYDNSYDFISEAQQIMTEIENRINDEAIEITLDDLSPKGSK